MALRQRTARNMRAHWRLLCIPVGIVVNACGNALYESPRRNLGLFLFLAGGALSLFGARYLKRFLKENPLHEGTVNVIAAVSMLACITAISPVVAVAKGIGEMAAQPSDYRAAGASLTLICLTLPPILRWLEPSDFIFQRLPGRIRRAAIFRTVANAAGILAVAMFLKFRFGVVHPAPLISTALTLLVAMTVVTHKTFARTRRLCTQIHVDTQSLLRDLEELDRARGNGTTGRSRKWPLMPKEANDKHDDTRVAARRSWDALKRDLSTTVDTGYRRIGLSFLPAEVIAELEKKVLDGIKADDSSTSAPAREDLQSIRDACADHIDVLA
ncbi:hypothetical protein [Streptomyces sp. NPDC054975]